VAGLRNDGVSYVFVGEHKLDLGLALEVVNRELGIKHLVLEGGGTGEPGESRVVLGSRASPLERYVNCAQSGRS
jgi:hypothetical protein